MLWLLIALAILALWIIVKPTWAPKPPQLPGNTNRAIENAGERVTHLVQRAEESRDALYRGVAQRLPLRRDQKQLAVRFREWITNQTPSHENELFDQVPAHAQGMMTWLSTLSDKEMQGFTERVERFTSLLGLNLEWLMSDQVDAYPEIKRALEEVVILYGICEWRASQVKGDVKAFLAYQAWDKRPSQHRALGQKLYSGLVQQGLVMTSPDLYLAPEHARDAEAARAIRTIAATKPEAIAAIMREWVAPPSSLEIEPAPQPVAA